MKMLIHFQRHSRIWCHFVVVILTILTRTSHVAGIDAYNAVGRYPSALNWWAGTELSFYHNMTRLNALKTVEHNHSLEDNFFVDLERYLQDYETSIGDLVRFNSGSRKDQVWTITSNPIASYRMMRRIVHMLPDLMNPVGKFDATLVQELPTDWWPKLQDIQDTMLGILRIHHIYDLNISLFSEGNILGRTTGTRLLGLHCYEIGIHAHTQGFHTLAVEWLELAKVKTTVDKTIDKSLINTALIYTTNRHNQLFDTRWASDPYFFEEKFESNSSSKGRRRMREVLVDTFKGRKEPQYNDVNFWALCSNGSLQTETEKSKLFCWHETKMHPVWLLKPLRMELLARDPDVVQMYDILSDEKIERIKEIALPSLLISNVVDHEANTPGATKLSWVRTSVGAWVTESHDSLLTSIPHSIEQMTGLKVVQPTSSEMLQVGSYTFSGHYEIHLDALKDPAQYGEDKGDRVATFMFYLNDVEMGGRTAFAQARTVANPVKGSAVFWYNIHRDGTTDYSTYHGACPVIIGQKWVANKWIRIRDQLLTHPCSRDSAKDRFHIPVNGKLS